MNDPDLQDQIINELRTLLTLAENGVITSIAVAAVQKLDDHPVRYRCHAKHSDVYLLSGAVALLEASIHRAAYPLLEIPAAVNQVISLDPKLN